MPMMVSATASVTVSVTESAMMLAIAPVPALVEAALIAVVALSQMPRAVACFRPGAAA